MKNFFNKLSNRIEAFKRKNNIDCYRSEKEGLANLVYKTLKERGELNRVQRSQALKMVVEKWKAEEQKYHIEATKSYLESEESNDVARAINMFGLKVEL